MDVILKKVRRARARLVLSRFRQLFVYYLAGAWAAAAVVSAASRPGFIPLLVGFFAAGVAGILAAAVHALVARPSPRTAALALDRASGLRERLSTAILVRSSASPVDRAVVEDAVRAAPAADPALIPLSRVRRGWWPAIPPLVFVASLAVPGLARVTTGDPAMAAEASISVPAPIRKEASSGLWRRAFHLERRAGERDLPELRDLAQAMRQISEEIRRSEMSQAEALSKLSRLEEKARERRKELSERAGVRDPQMRNMEGGSASAPGDEKSRRAEELDRKMAELKQKLEETKSLLAKGGPEGAAKDLQKALSELGKELEGLGSRELEGLGGELEKLGEGDKPVDPEALSKLLETMDRELKDFDGLMEGLGLLDGELEALRALKGDFTGKFFKCPT